MSKIGIHLFRKDLRVVDNLALDDLSKVVDRIVGVFIFDPIQIRKRQTNKHFYSLYAAQFVIDSVNDLSSQCDNKLIVAYGETTKIIEKLIKTIKPSALSFNADYTPYSLQRDKNIEKLCHSYDIDLIVNDDDQTLIPMKALTKSDNTPYMVFGMFLKHLFKFKVGIPKNGKKDWFKPRVDFDTLDWKPIQSSEKGGRTEALKILKRSYDSTDLLITDTSHLSAYLNQGCISIREAYHHYKQKKMNENIRKIAWRDFFLCIYRFCPNGNSYTKFIDERYNMIKWKNVKQSDWQRFIKYDTGFLMVDAIMAELCQTGYINNRARLILGTFWIKYLQINPFHKEYGSQVGYSNLLMDCSASQNKLNHQWLIGDLDLSGRRFKMKGTHALTGRMIRIDNDMIKKFDPQFKYISKWLPRFQGKSLKEQKQMMKETKPMYEWRQRYLEYAKLFDNIG